MINVDPEQTIEAGESIVSSAKEFQDNVKNIYEVVEDLKTEWTGSAAQRFTDNIESFKEQYEKFGKLLNDFGDLLSAIGKDYRDLDENL